MHYISVRVLPCQTDCFSTDNSPIKGKQDEGVIKYDYLVYAVGAETQTFNIPGVKENSCFMKELRDAEKVCSLDHSHKRGYLTFVRSISFVNRSWIVSPTTLPCVLLTYN